MDVTDPEADAELLLDLAELIASACRERIIAILANAFPASVNSRSQEGCDFYVPHDRSSLTAQRRRISPQSGFAHSVNGLLAPCR
jgi:hypothetical protein